MAYEPLHHKYRPQTFAQLVGQSAIATTLCNALQQRRIAPAYLFTGPRGTGKTSSARILAKSLNCISVPDPTPQPCGGCEVCRTIAQGAALDVIEIDAASNTGVDNIRELIERSQFAPVQCRYKVYVIDECHMLSTAAFNALLKTLEEPPDRIVFVLATTDPQRVPATIISRCQRFDFRRIPLADMARHLQTIASQEQIEIASDSVQLIAQMAQGGLRDAESLLDQLSLLDGEITVERVWDLVGAVPERDLLDLLRVIAHDDAVAVLDRARQLIDRGREPLILLQNLASFYRDLLIAKTAPDRGDLVAMTSPTWIELCRFAKTIEIGVILHGQQHLRSAEMQVKQTTQPRLWLEVTLLGLLPASIAQQSASELRDSQPASDRRSPERRSTPSVPLPTASVQPKPALPEIPVAPPAPPEVVEASPIEQSELLSDEPPTAPPTAPLTAPPVLPDLKTTAETMVPATPEAVEAKMQVARLQQVWRQVLESLHPLSQSLLRDHGRLTALSDQQAEITIKSDNLIKIAQNKLPDIEKGFRKVLGQSVRIALVVAANPEIFASPDAPSEDVSNPPPAPIRSAASPDSAPRLADRADRSLPSVPTAETQPPQNWQPDDEVTKAAKSLAQMFNGQIVNLDDDLGEAAASESPTATAEDLELAANASLEIADDSDDEDDDIDIPF